LTKQTASGQVGGPAARKLHPTGLAKNKKKQVLGWGKGFPPQREPKCNPENGSKTWGGTSVNRSDVRPVDKPPKKTRALENDPESLRGREKKKLFP